ncbi:helix-hairpin-helix domain-containing protein [Tumebacillus sp. ITR2]|uniref:Helix-hairpin-helix domain-containing protein n=1 Tax=Tumebacillus amylolyticus TaxID=2801339 RepID=A0ABS1JAQ0_9BACL|nr:ComEA family DNA-binding protein [Tumebacillus amylolyticus]MBL0387315.1 helix-hairpin-helix domain-containing protein [Tumebacillus amylolyticus]
MKKERFLLLAVLAGVLMAGSVYLYGGKPKAQEATVPIAEATSKEQVPAQQQAGQSVRVDVKGEVNTPGVYQLPADSRTIDAVQAAGGAKSDGDLAKLNMAAPLKDGTEVVVPKMGAQEGKKDSTTQSSAAEDGKLNLNTASVADLDKLPGIGSARAEAIIKYREDQGNFLTVDDLRKIPGFGVKLVDQIRDRVTVN